MHDILPLTLALVARGASSGRWHSQHPHAFRASSHRRAACRQPADTPPLAQNTAIYTQWCSIARCGASPGRWHSQHPHAFGASLAPLWNCRCAGRQPTDTTTRAQNTAICRQMCKTGSLTSPGARHPAGGTHSTLTLFGASLELPPGQHSTDKSPDVHQPSEFA